MTAVVSQWVLALARFVAGTYVALGVLVVTAPVRLRLAVVQRRMLRLDRDLADARQKSSWYETEAALHRARLSPLDRLEQRARQVCEDWLARDDPDSRRRYESWQQAAFRVHDDLTAAKGERLLDAAYTQVTRLSQAASWLDDPAVVVRELERAAGQDAERRAHVSRLRASDMTDLRLRIVFSVHGDWPSLELLVLALRDADGARDLVADWLEDARAAHVQTATQVLVAVERAQAAIWSQRDAIRPVSTETGGLVGRLRIDLDHARMAAVGLKERLPVGATRRWRALLGRQLAFGTVLVGGLIALGVTLAAPWNDLAWVVTAVALGVGGVAGGNEALRSLREDTSGARLTVIGAEALIVAALAVLLGNALAPSSRIGPTDVVDKLYLVTALLAFVVVAVFAARVALDTLVPGKIGAVLGVAAAIPVLFFGVQIGAGSADYVGSSVLCTDMEPAPPRPVRATSVPPRLDPADLPARAVIDTSCGRITVELSGPDSSPSAVNAFVHLARRHFYDGMRWDYVLGDGLVAAGDPSGGHGSLPGFDYPVPEGRFNRFSPGVAGVTVDAAQRGSSRFFIAGSDGYAFPNGASYPVLGAVSDGVEVIDHLSAYADGSGAGTSERPVYISSISVRSR